MIRCSLISNVYAEEAPIYEGNICIKFYYDIFIDFWFIYCYMEEFEVI